MLQFRKSKTGAWNIFGPVSEVRIGTVTVTKRDGTTTTAEVTGMSRLFSVDGVPHCYGFLEAKAQKNNIRKYPRTGCSCGSREGITQDTDCFTYRHDAE